MSQVLGGSLDRWEELPHSRINRSCSIPSLQVSSVCTCLKRKLGQLLVYAISTYTNSHFICIKTERSHLIVLSVSDVPTVLPMQLQMPQDTNMTEVNVRRRRSSSSADIEDSVLPPKILTASHLSSLRDLVSDKKITGCAILPPLPSAICFLKMT